MKKSELTTFKRVDEMLEKKEDAPLPLAVIPNYMGINLSSVEGVSWCQQADGQLTSLTIHFLPTVDKHIQRLLDVKCEDCTYTKDGISRCGVCLHQIEFMLEGARVQEQRPKEH